MTATADNPLLHCVAEQAARPAPAALQAVVEALRLRFADSLQGVLFYGSCLRSGDLLDGLVDAYAVVDDYANAYSGRWLPLANRWLPPNVFYLECDSTAGALRVKHAVLSLEDLERGTAGWFHPYLWGRFAQPVRIGHARNDAVRRRMEAALASATTTFLAEAAPCLNGEFSAEQLWVSGLRLSYRSELRPEAAGRTAELVGRELADYRARTEAAAGAGLLEAAGDDRYRSPADFRQRRRARRRWAARRWQGKALSVARLAKAAFTFDGGVDYAAWKIQRHTGLDVPVTNRLRRHPLVFGWVALWRLLRSRALR